MRANTAKKGGNRGSNRVKAEFPAGYRRLTSCDTRLTYGSPAIFRWVSVGVWGREFTATGD